MKVNKSGHYVWAPVNSCSLVSLCFKKRGGRCDHEKSLCLFFSSHYRRGVWLSSSASPLSPLFYPFLSLLSPLQLSFSASCFSLPLAHFCHPSTPRPSPLSMSLPLLSDVKTPTLPAQCFSNMQEGRDQWCPRRGNYTAEFR